MDFTQFDQRAAADRACPFDLLHPETREPIVDGDGKTARVLILGAASRRVQAAIREQALSALEATDKPEAQTMEDAHNTLVSAAVPYIAGFENVDRDGVPLTAERDDVLWFLGLSFPRAGQDEDGKITLENYPFANQVVDFAAEYGKSLGNG
ncbi:hypothetical protein [Halovulum sp. GXIMD14793]